MNNGRFGGANLIHTDHSIIPEPGRRQIFMKRSYPFTKFNR